MKWADTMVTNEQLMKISWYLTPDEMRTAY